MIEADHLVQVARQELGYLHEACRSPVQDQWSIQCDHIKERIKALTPLVGPTPRNEIQMPLLKDGIYQQIHATLGIEVTVDIEQVSQVRARLNVSRSSA